jgi:hypothetical protein
MAIKLSTGLRQAIQGEGSLRKILEDAVLNLYSGPAPATADEAPTGTLLCSVTKSSGAVSANERSTPKLYVVLIGSHASAETFKFDVTVDGVGPTTYTYTNTPDLDLNPLTTAIARMLNDIPQLSAIATGASGYLYVQSRFAGLGFTLAVAAAPGTGTITSVTKVTDEVRSDALSFGPPSAGRLSKTAAEVWSGVNLATGVAGYYRIVTSSDLGTNNTSDKRIQGTTSTSGSDFDMSSVSLTAAATTTVDGFYYEEPVSA